MNTFKRLKKVMLTLSLLQFFFITLDTHGQLTTAHLSQPRGSLSAVSVGTKVFFAGGSTYNGGNPGSIASSTVDIYDNSINTWIAVQLSVARRVKAATVGTKVFFGGGSVVDIFDNSTNSWTTANLSQTRTDLAAASVGTKVFFAGGSGTVYSNVVDVYNNSTNTWSTATLSQPRANLVGTSVGSKVLFAGGYDGAAYSNVVDIYDNNTNTWTTATLSKARYHLAATSVGTKVFFAGGWDGTSYTNVVDIYDNATNTWSTSTLSQARGYLAATTTGTKVFFAGGISGPVVPSNIIDIYDNSNNTWSTETLAQPRYRLTATSLAGKVYFAGGNIDAYVQNDHCSDLIDIYDNTTNTWMPSTLSQGRTFSAAATVGTKVLFAGGDFGYDVFAANEMSDRVDIYDNSNNNWTTATLSQKRRKLAAASTSTKAFFGGGEFDQVGSISLSNVVDIYNSSNNAWTTATLSKARINLCATTVGNKVFFAGGSDYTSTFSNVVDIYDNSSNTWTTATLSLPRERITAASVGTKVFFAGGSTLNGNPSNVVDIYDNSTNTWTTATLSRARHSLAATSVGTKIFFAGGFGYVNNQPTQLSTVDIYDNSTNTWTTATLSEGRSNLVAAANGSKVFFAGGGIQGFSSFYEFYSNALDIYDNSTNTWKKEYLSVARGNLVAASIGTKVLFAGGTGNFQGSNLGVIPSTYFNNAVDIYDNSAPAILSFTPTSGTVGSVVTISGINFSAIPASNTVKFNGTSAVVNTSTASSITVTVPTGTTTGLITVAVAGKTGSSSTNFTVTLPPPTVTSFTPTSGSVGTPVTITGTNFSTTAANNIVKFNGTTATITGTPTATSITTIVPTGTTTGKITVEVVGQVATSSSNFTVTIPPHTITSINPISGIVGTSVTISGTNFNTTASNNIVKFNGTTATISATPTTTSIITNVPVGATTGKITVEVAGQIATSTSDFTVLACLKPTKPTITASGINTELPTLTSSSTTGNQWFKNNTLILGATSSSLQITSPGIYKVQVTTTTGGCISDFSVDFVIIITGDIGNQIDKSAFKFYPNPVEHNLVIEVPQSGEKTLRLFSNNGMLLDEITFNTEKTEVNVERYATGMHYFVITSTGKTVVNKFLKK